MQRFIAGLSIYMMLTFPGVAQNVSGSADDTLAAARLETLIQEALENNPQIKSAEQQQMAVTQRVEQVSALDDPMFTYTHWFSSVETRVGPLQNSFMLSQRLPFFGKLRFRGNIAEQDIEVAEQAYKATRRDVTYKVKLTYFDLYWIDQSLSILDEYQRLLQSFQEVASRKYATGMGIQANVLKAHVEISSIKERRLNFAKLREGAAARLHALLGREEATRIDRVSTVDTTLYVRSEQELVQMALAARQELKATEALIQKAEFGIQLAKRNYWPDFTISASYTTVPPGRTLAPDNGKDPWSVQAGINLPIWFGKLKAAVEEVRAARNANRMSYEDLKNEVLAEIQDLFARLKTAEQTIILYQASLIPNAERSLQSVLSSYQTGTLDFLTLLDSERMLLQFRLAYVKELANYRQQIAALQRAVGSELP
jgi:outer membrane protein TolC